MIDAADNDRTVSFELNLTCDWCGAVGASDLMGNCLCPKCAGVYDQTYAGQVRKLCAMVDDMKQAVRACGWFGKVIVGAANFLARLIAAWERACGKYNV